MDLDVTLAFLLEEDQEEDELLHNMSRATPNKLFSTRKTEGFFVHLIRNHLRNDEERFRKFFRLNPGQFDFVLSLVREDISKMPTYGVPEPIEAEEKLALTLRFLVLGESFASLAYGFRISSSYVSILIRHTLDALCRHLVPIFLPPPTKASFKKNATEFYRLWDFPNCCAAIDGKHMRIRCPRKSGSLFWNYKNYFSIVLLALVDANYKFVAIDVGSYGKEGDGGIFSKSSMGKKICDGTLFPPDKELPFSSIKMPYVVVGDEAFKLHRHILKPYTRSAAQNDPTKAVFNYKLSKARRVSENAFALLCQVFRVFYTEIAVKPETCDKLVIACCCLHNLLRDAYLENQARPYYEVDQESRFPHNFASLSRSGGFSQAESFGIRDEFKNYVNQLN